MIAGAERPAVAQTLCAAYGLNTPRRAGSAMEFRSAAVSGVRETIRGWSAEAYYAESEWELAAQAQEGRLRVPGAGRRRTGPGRLRRHDDGVDQHGGPR